MRAFLSGSFIAGLCAACAGSAPAPLSMDGPDTSKDYFSLRANRLEPGHVVRSTKHTVVAVAGVMPEDPNLLAEKGWTVDDKAHYASRAEDVVDYVVVTTDGAAPTRFVQTTVANRLSERKGAAGKARATVNQDPMLQIPVIVSADVAGWRRELKDGNPSLQQKSALSDRGHPLDWHWYPSRMVTVGAQFELPEDALGRGMRSKGEVTVKAVAPCGDADRCAELFAHIEFRQTQGSTEVKGVIEGTIIRSLSAGIDRTRHLEGTVTFVSAELSEESVVRRMAKGKYTIDETQTLARAEQ